MIVTRGSNDDIYVPKVWENDERREKQQEGDDAAEKVDVAENDRLMILLLYKYMTASINIT